MFETLNGVIANRITLWYPSSGEDISDVLYCNSTFLPNVDVPSLYLHTDILDYEEQIAAQLRGYRCFSQIRHSTAHLENTSFNIFHFEHFRQKKILIQFTIDNYEFLVKHVLNKILTQFLVTTCDGITTGSSPQGVGNGISTTFLTRLYGILGVKYHINEYADDPRELVENAFFQRNPLLFQLLVNGGHDIEFNEAALINIPPWNRAGLKLRIV